MRIHTIWSTAVLATSLAALTAGCKSNVPAPGEAPIVDGTAAVNDPSAANLATPATPVAYRQTGTRVAASSFAAPQQAYSESYPQQQAPQQAASSTNYGVGNSQQNEAYRYNTQQPANSGQNGDAYGGDPAANAAEYEQYSQLLDPNVPAAEQAPPPLPEDYQQPEAPGPDYLWTPGYWDYASSGYYYVPGVWVGAPYAGALWTPGWWGFIGGRYRWHHGYWGRHVGYYGGINYGFGYVGYGYQGGYWNNDHFWYNRSVLRVNPRFVNNNVYQRNVTVENRTYVNSSRVSFVGGNGGLRRGPAPQEMAALHEQRTPPMQVQMENRQAAQSNRAQFFSTNHGRPETVFASRPLAADRNVQAPPRTGPVQGMQTMTNGGRPGEAGRPGTVTGVQNGTRVQGDDQRTQMNNGVRNLQMQNQQLQNQQRVQGVQNGIRVQGDQQRNQLNDQARNQQQLQNQQVQNQQRVQQEQQRTQGVQGVQNGIRVQGDQQRNQLNDQVRNQQQLQNQSLQNQQRMQQEQQRTQGVQGVQNGMRVQGDQRTQMNDQIHAQQVQNQAVQNQQRVQQEQQRTPQVQGVQNGMRVQSDQQRGLLNDQMQQRNQQVQDQQRVQQQMNVQRQGPMPQVIQQRSQPQPQPQVQQRFQQPQQPAVQQQRFQQPEAARPSAPAPHMEAPRAAPAPPPAPHMSAPAPHPGGGGEAHGGGHR